MISRVDVEKFLEEKTTTNKCGVCSKTDWIIPSDENEPMLSLTCDLHITQVDGSIRIPSLAIPLVVIACSHCGYVRSFSLNVIKKGVSNA